MARCRHPPPGSAQRDVQLQMSADVCGHILASGEKRADAVDVGFYDWGTRARCLKVGSLVSNNR